MKELTTKRLWDYVYDHDRLDLIREVIEPYLVRLAQRADEFPFPVLFQAYPAEPTRLMVFVEAARWYGETAEIQVVRRIPPLVPSALPPDISYLSDPSAWVWVTPPELPPAQLLALAE